MGTLPERSGSINMEAALVLAGRGIPVLPCDWRAGEHEKAPLIPSPGFHLATVEVEQIRRWWSRWPKALIGMPIPPGLLALDGDPRHGFNIDDLGPLPPTLTVWSGRNDGGVHLYFEKPDGPLTSARLPKGIDLKLGGKGYCIVPPSLHPATGQPYRWEWRRPAGLPRRLLALLRPVERPRAERIDRKGVPHGGGLVHAVATATEGKRHNTLVWASFRARDDGILDDLEPDLIAASVSTGFPDDDARAVIDSVRRSAQ